MDTYTRNKFERVWLEYIQTLPPLDIINDASYREKLKEFACKVYAEGVEDAKTTEIEDNGDMKEALIDRLYDLIDELQKWK